MEGIRIYNNDGRILTTKMITEIRKMINKNKDIDMTLIIQGGTLKKF